jgi:hypothetical protein
MDSQSVDSRIICYSRLKCILPSQLIAFESAPVNKYGNVVHLNEETSSQIMILDNLLNMIKLSIKINVDMGLH